MLMVVLRFKTPQSRLTPCQLPFQGSLGSGNKPPLKGEGGPPKAVVGFQAISSAISIICVKLT